MRKKAQHPAYPNIRKAIEDEASPVDAEEQARLVLRMIETRRPDRRQLEVRERPAAAG